MDACRRRRFGRGLDHLCLVQHIDAELAVALQDEHARHRRKIRFRAQKRTAKQALVHLIDPDPPLEQIDRLLAQIRHRRLDLYRTRRRRLLEVERISRLGRGWEAQGDGQATLADGRALHLNRFGGVGHAQCRRRALAGGQRHPHTERGGIRDVHRDRLGRHASDQHDHLGVARSRPGDPELQLAGFQALPDRHRRLWTGLDDRRAQGERLPIHLERRQLLGIGRSADDRVVDLAHHLDLQGDLLGDRHRSRRRLRQHRGHVRRLLHVLLDRIAAILRVRGNFHSDVRHCDEGVEAERRGRVGRFVLAATAEQQYAKKQGDFRTPFRHACLWKVL